MQPLINNLAGQKRIWVGISALFFAASYLFLNLSIKPELIYYYFQISRKKLYFNTSSIFLLDCLSYPSGLSQYIASLFTQLCYFPWLGSFLIILIILGFYLLSVTTLDFPKKSLWRFVPAILILIICDRYENPFGYSIALLIVMIIAALYQKLSVSSGWLKCVLFLISSVLLYYLAGAAVLIFVVLAALFELFQRRSPVFCVACLLLGTAVSWLTGAFFFRMDESDSYFSFIPLLQAEQVLQQEQVAKYSAIALLVFFPAAVLVTNISRLFRKTSDSRQQTGATEKSSLIDAVNVNVPGFMLIAAAAILYFHNSGVTRSLQVNYFANQRMWPEVLSAVRKGPLKKYYPYGNNAVNRALFHTGRMSDEMFTFPQSQSDSDLVFCKKQQGGMNYNLRHMERAEVCLELGMVNAAEEIAREFMVGPYILKQLAWINLVKGQTESARVYFNALSQYPAYGREAAEILQQLEKDPLLERNERVRYLRAIAENNDITYLGNDYDEERWLTKLLQRNKNNKMAFEYLMAHYLLNRRLDKFVENLPRLDDFGYENIPRHYQEAILIYQAAKKKEVNIGGRAFDTKVIRQFNEISAIRKSKNFNDLPAIRNELESKYGGTYFLFYTFGDSK